MRLGTQEMFGVLEVKGEATEASSSEREMPPWALLRACSDNMEGGGSLQSPYFLFNQSIVALRKLERWNVPHSRLRRLHTYPHSSCKKSQEVSILLVPTLKLEKYTYFSQVKNTKYYINYRTYYKFWLYRLTPLPAASPQVGFSDPGPF